MTPPVLIGILFVITLILAISLDGYKYEGFKILNIALSFCFGLWTLINIIIFVKLPYSHDELDIKMRSVQTTLDNSRLVGNGNENATITTQVLRLNNNLEEKKYHNTLWWYNWKIDDRIYSINIIK